MVSKLMKQLLVPAILTATLMIVGIYAFIPVDEATTVHTTIIAAITGDTDDIDAAITAHDGNIDGDVGTHDTDMDTAHGLLSTSAALTLHDGNIDADLLAHDGAAPVLTVLSRTTSAGTLVASGTGVATVTCTGFAAGGAADDIEIGGVFFADVSEGLTFTVALSGQAIIWVLDAGQDAATCVGTLIG